MSRTESEMRDTEDRAPDERYSGAARDPGRLATGPSIPVEGVAVVELHPFRTEFALAPDDLDLKLGEVVVFHDQNGEDIGKLVGAAEAEPDAVPATVVRRATSEDLAQRDENRARADDCLRTFRRLVRQFRLPMKPVDAQLRLDRREICFYFVSDERLNFRSLHKAISAELHMRVAVRQVGVRDYCRAQGGIGVCGRVLCCAGFLTELKPITLRMARQQSLFVEPAKISGVCGKLLCCLGFEECTYRSAMDQFPKVGTVVRTEQGKGRVSAVDIFNRRVAVVLEDGEVSVTLDELKRE